jgi:hypothetical protein
VSWLDALGWAGSALLIFSVMQARVIRLRALNLLACLVLVVFNGLLEIWSMVAMNLALSAINVYFLVKLLRERHDERAFEVLEVSPTDEYLRHVLRVHGGDILRFQPDFVWDGATEGHRSYLVQHGDETVGVVLVRDLGDGTAQVVLDYVTRRYRDFSPGEFVWRRSQLLKDSGFRRVVTPAGMVNPYYERLNFHREGESFALDL